jgi:hypothetical protein
MPLYPGKHIEAEQDPPVVASKLRLEEQLGVKLFVKTDNRLKFKEAALHILSLITAIRNPFSR